MPIISTPDGFDLVLGGRVVLRHTAAAPCLFVGVGQARIGMNRGNFSIEDRLTERTPLRHAAVMGNRIAFAAAPGQPAQLTVTMAEWPGQATLAFDAADARINRVWLRVPAEPDEHVWGGGEQMSYLDLPGAPRRTGRR